MDSTPRAGSELSLSELSRLAGGAAIALNEPVFIFGANQQTGDQCFIQLRSVSAFAGASSLAEAGSVVLRPYMTSSLSIRQRPSGQTWPRPP